MALGLCPACDPQAYHAGHLTLNVNSRVEANRREIRQQASPGPIWINKRNPSALSQGIDMAHSRYLAGLDALKRAELEHRLFARQSGRCFICDKPIDLILHKGQLDIDHIDPLIEEGLDAENNFAITHASCNRSKGAANLEIARRLAEFQSLQEQAQEAGKRGASLGDVLARYGGAKALLQIRREGTDIKFSVPEAGDNSIRQGPVFRDKLSGMDSFFTALPLEYLHHDDRINPRSIGANIRGLIEEFLQKRPQLHVGLAWWAPGTDGAGAVKVFDGQHKAAAQILLGGRELPVRVFLEPKVTVLLQANTNAGGKLRQVAFDIAVMRHLGSSLMSIGCAGCSLCADSPRTTIRFPNRTLCASFAANGGRWSAT